MTDDEKKKLFDGFRQTVQDDDVIENDWTEEEILAAGKRIMERMGLDEELQ